MPWDDQQQAVAGGLLTRLYQDNEPLRYSQVLSLWQHNRAFSEFFISCLQALPYVAYKWETPSISAHHDPVFEYVALNKPSLDRQQNPSAFSHYVSQQAGCESFWNLGGDALLVCPNQHSLKTNYCHLASFNRTASQDQQIAFWQCVGKTMADELSDQPRWLSTAGEGVPWLHMRIDQRPKYYGYQGYC